MSDTALSADGVPVCFEARGTGTGGPTLVFVHGWSCDRRYWADQLSHFAERYQVVAVDLAGHGESGMGREAWTMPAFGADVVAVAEKLGLGPMVLVGHSMGGEAIVEAALRLGDCVAGLVWVDTYRTLGGAQSAAKLERFLSPFRVDFVAATRNWARSMFVPSSDPELAEWVISDMASAPPEVAIASLQHALSFEPAIVTALQDMTTSVVAINPDYLPNDIEALRRHGVKAVLMPGVGHFAMMEDPDAFNRLLAEAVDGFTSSPARTGSPTPPS
jgi:pimeloyl-ACP methyl ester carboxylesterase